MRCLVESSVTAIWRRTPTRRDGDQSKMMSRGRGRRASVSGPGNGGAPAPALARRSVHGAACWGCATSSTNAWALRSTRHISNPVLCSAAAHRAWRQSPRQCSRHDIGAGSLGVAGREPARALEKAWSAYRKTAGLNLYGHTATSEPAPLPVCAHADER